MSTVRVKQFTYVVYSFILLKKIYSSLYFITTFVHVKFFVFPSIDEYGCQYKHFTIYLNFACLPKIKQLLNDNLNFINPLHRNYTIENNFKAYTFVRFQFPNYGTQMSQLIFLPNDDDNVSDRQSNIVEVSIKSKLLKIDDS